MRTTIYIILSIVILLWLGGFTVTFKPFTVSLPDWHKPLAFLLLWLAMLAYTVGEYTKGYAEGFSNGVDRVIEEIENRSND